MKTIFTLLTSMIMGISVIAAPAGIAARPKSMLTVKSAVNGDIRVVLDGRRFEPGENSLVIRELQPGNHQIRVYRQKSNGLFNIFGKGYEMVYSTAVMLKPATHVKITIDRFGRTSIDERKIRGNAGRGRNRNYKDRDDDWGSSHDYDFDRDGKFGDYDTNYGYEQGMNDREFNQVLQSISMEWLESNKLKSATQIVKTSSLTSAQVKQLVLLFSFESNKLDLAKQAYTNTVDKKNYFMINDVFSFNSSREELARFIRNFH